MYRDFVNANWDLWSVLLVHPDFFHLRQCSDAVVTDDLAKYSIQSIQMGSFIEQNEELRPIRARTLIRHGDNSSVAVSQRWSNLVLERATPY